MRTLMGRLRRCFSGEFSWRLYVVLQVPALLLFAVIVVDGVSKGNLPVKTKYENVYEWVNPDPSVVEAARVMCAPLSERPDGRGRFAIEEDESPRERCLREARALPYHSLVGQKPAGVVVPVDLVFFLLLILVAPFVLVRVPTWLWEGWHSPKT